MVEFYLLTFPRFPLRKKEHKTYIGKNRTHDFRTSRCADDLLDHSADEGCQNYTVVLASGYFPKHPVHAHVVSPGCLHLVTYLFIFYPHGAPGPAICQMLPTSGIIGRDYIIKRL